MKMKGWMGGIFLLFFVIPLYSVELIDPSQLQTKPKQFGSGGVVNPNQSQSQEAVDDEIDDLISSLQSGKVEDEKEYELELSEGDEDYPIFDDEDEGESDWNPFDEEQDSTKPKDNPEEISAGMGDLVNINKPEKTDPVKEEIDEEAEESVEDVLDDLPDPKPPVKPDTSTAEEIDAKEEASQQNTFDFISDPDMVQLAQNIIKQGADAYIQIGQNGMDASDYFVENNEAIAELIKQAVITTYSQFDENEEIAQLAGNSSALSIKIASDVLAEMENSEILLNHNEEVASVLGDAIYLYLQEHGDELAELSKAGTEEAILIASEIAAGLDLEQIVADHMEKVADLTGGALSYISEQQGNDEVFTDMVSTGGSLAVLIGGELYTGMDTLQILNNHHNEITSLVEDSVEYIALNNGADADTAVWLSDGASLSTTMIIDLANDKDLEKIFIDNLDSIVNVSSGAITIIGDASGLDEDVTVYITDANELLLNLSAGLMQNEDSLAVLSEYQQGISDFVGDGFVLYGGNAGWNKEQTQLASEGASLGTALSIQLLSGETPEEVILDHQDEIIDLSGQTVAYALTQNGLDEYAELGSDSIQTALEILIEAGFSDQEISVILDDMRDQIKDVTGEAAYLAGIEAGLEKDEAELASLGSQLVTDIAIDLANGATKDEILSAYEDQIADLSADVSGAIAENGGMNEEQVALIETGVNTGAHVINDLVQGKDVDEVLNENRDAIVSALNLYIEYVADQNNLSETDAVALLQGVNTIVDVLYDSMNGLSAEEIMDGNLASIQTALHAANESVAMHLEMDKDQLGLLNNSANVALAIVNELIHGGEVSDALVKNEELISSTIRDAVVMTARDQGLDEEITDALGDASKVSTQMIIEIAAGNMPIEEVLSEHRDEIADLSGTGAKLAAEQAGASEEVADLAGDSANLAARLGIDLNAGADPNELIYDNRDEIVDISERAAGLTASEAGLGEAESALVGEGTATIIDIAIALNNGDDVGEVLQDHKKEINSISTSAAGLIADNYDLDEDMVGLIESGTGALSDILVDLGSGKDGLEIMNDNRDSISTAIHLASVQAGTAADLGESELALLGDGVNATLNILYDVLNGADGEEILANNREEIASVIKSANSLIVDSQGLTENDLAVMNSGVDVAIELAMGIMEGKSADEIFVDNVEGINNLLQAGVSDIAERTGLSDETYDLASLSTETVLNVIADIVEGKDTITIIEENQIAIKDTVVSGVNVVTELSGDEQELLETGVGTGLDLALDIIAGKSTEEIVKENGENIVQLVDIGTTVVSQQAGLDKDTSAVLGQTTSTVANIAIDLLSGKDGTQVFLDNQDAIASTVGGLSELGSEYMGLEGDEVSAISSGATSAINIAADIIAGKDASTIFIENREGIVTTIGHTANAIASNTGMGEAEAGAITSGAVTTLNIIGDILEGKDNNEILYARNEEIGDTLGNISNVVATNLGASSEAGTAIGTGVSTAIQVFSDIVEGKDMQTVIAENSEGIIDTITTGMMALNGTAGTSGVNVAMSAVKVGADLYDAIQSGDFDTIEFLQSNVGDIANLGVNIASAAGVAVNNFPVAQAAGLAFQGLEVGVDMFTDYRSGMDMEEVLAENAGSIAALAIGGGRLGLAAATGGVSEAVFTAADIGIGLISGGNVNSTEALIKFGEIICGVDIDGDGDSGFIAEDGSILMAVGSGIQYGRDAVATAVNWTADQVYSAATYLGINDELDAVLNFAGDALSAVGDLALDGLSLAFDGIGYVVDAFTSTTDAIFGAPAPPICGSDSMYSPDIVPPKPTI